MFILFLLNPRRYRRPLAVVLLPVILLQTSLVKIRGYVMLALNVDLTLRRCCSPPKVKKNITMLEQNPS